MPKILCEYNGVRQEIEESELLKRETCEEGHINGAPAGCYATEYYKDMVGNGTMTLVHRSVHIKAHNAAECTDSVESKEGN